MKTTLYVVLTTKLALHNFAQRKDGSNVVILNDNLGDFAYVDLADAVSEGKKAFETPEMQGERTVTVIHVIVDHAVKEGLALRGHIKQEADYAGNRIWKLDETACRELNAQALMLMDVYPLPISGQVSVSFLPPQGGSERLN